METLELLSTYASDLLFASFASRTYIIGIVEQADIPNIREILDFRCVSLNDITPNQCDDSECSVLSLSHAIQTENLQSLVDQLATISPALKNTLLSTFALNTTYFSDTLYRKMVRMDFPFLQTKPPKLAVLGILVDSMIIAVPHSRCYFIFARNGKLETISKLSGAIISNQRVISPIKLGIHQWLLNNVPVGDYVFEIVLEKDEKVGLLDIYVENNTSLLHLPLADRQKLLNKYKKSNHIYLVRSTSVEELCEGETFLIKPRSHSTKNRCDFIYNLPNMAKHYLLIGSAPGINQGGKKGSARDQYYFATLQHNHSNKMFVYGYVSTYKKNNAILCDHELKNPIDQSSFEWLCPKPANFKHFKFPILVTDKKISRTPNIHTEPYKMTISSQSESALHTDASAYAILEIKNSNNSQLKDELLLVHKAVENFSEETLKAYMSAQFQSSKSKRKNKNGGGVADKSIAIKKNSPKHSDITYADLISPSGR